MAAAAYSTVLSPPSLPEGDGEGDGHDPPNWVLLDTLGYIAECPNASFAESSTSTGQRIEVSFCTARPPHVSHFCVHCPGLGPADFSLTPTVISAEADLILFCVSVSPSILFNPRYCDYFLYRAHPRGPSLDLLPHPHPHHFRNQEVALLSLGGEYAVSILTSRCLKVSLKEGGSLNETEFDLWLYRSSRAREGWTSKVVSVAETLRDAVCPADCAPYHETTKAITLRRGIVCWVDLWRGILLCNVLDENENPLLLDIPLPLPARGNWRLYHKCRSDKIRDITVSLLKDAIKYVEIEVCPPRNPPPDESYMDWFHQKRRDKRCNAPCTGWKARTWSLSTTAIPSWKEWRLDCTLDVADIYVQPIHSEQLPRPRSISDNPTQATLLQRLIIGFPTLSMDDDVVYMLSKACPMDQMEVVIAVDVRKKMLQGVAKLVTGKDFTYTRNCTSQISKYLITDR